MYVWVYVKDIQKKKDERCVMVGLYSPIKRQYNVRSIFSTHVVFAVTILDPSLYSGISLILVIIKLLLKDQKSCSSTAVYMFLY